MTIPILALPYTISGPGTYILTSDLTFPRSNYPAITIASPKAGKIIVDLEGFSLTGSAGYIGIYLTSNPTNSNVTVQNGTVKGFVYGIEAAADNMHINDITFAMDSSAGSGFFFNPSNSSTVQDCSFIGAGQYGIFDVGSVSGNSYSNDMFDGTQYGTLIIWDAGMYGGGKGIILKNCNFNVPKP